MARFKVVCCYCGWYLESYWEWVRPLMGDHSQTCKEYDLKMYNVAQGTDFDPVEDTSKYVARMCLNRGLWPKVQAAPAPDAGSQEE